jgi:hypothetical protein
MLRHILVLTALAPFLLGQTSERSAFYSSASSPLTPPSGRGAQEIALDFLAAAQAVPLPDLPSVYLAREYRDDHNGVTHLLYRQQFQGIEVHNAAWVTNIGPDGAVLSAGGTLYAAPQTAVLPDRSTALSALRAALAQVNPRLAATYSPFEVSPPAGRAASANSVRYAAGGFGADIEGRLVWFAHRGTPLLAWLFNVMDEDGVSSYDVAVEAATGAIIDQQPLTAFQSAPKGLVFDKGAPQPNPTPGVRLGSAPPLVDRALLPFTGDPVASPQGWVVNHETAGNNAIVGGNLLGLAFLATAPRTRAPNGDFSFPLQLGPSAPIPLAFGDAANTNLFYWINRAHDLFYLDGFDERAGNFQDRNHGRGGLEGDALLAFSHYGAAALGSPALNNAFFSTRSINDGSASMVAMYATVTGAAGFFADGAYAADTIVHEYTHGVSFRLLPNGYGSFQTAAMGEAWSDFYALEYTTPAGAPAGGVYTTGEYWVQSWGTGIRTRPYSTDTSVNPLTYADLGHVILAGPEVHADGEIWVEALWDARANLIQQLGEAEGRRRIRRLVLDGMKLSVPSPNMVEMRDAILLADRVNNNGASQSELWSAFAKRGLGTLAHSAGGDTVHVLSSADLPSPTGALRFYEDPFVAGEMVRLILADSNLDTPTVRVQLTGSAGDLEDVILRRSGSVYFGSILSSTAVVTRQNGFLNLVPGDFISAYYYDADTGSGAGRLIQATVSTQQPYSLSISTPAAGSPPPAPFPNETRLTNARAPVRVNFGFDFPFFSRKYRSMVVYPTGAIGFEPSVLTSLLRPGCNDVAELSRFPGIAPLFANLTFGTAQPNEGVFLSVTPDSVTVRWAAEPLTSSLVLPGSVREPVNFAVTLTSEGVITFRYGSGNQNLHTATQQLSTCGAQPVVGISSGHDVYAQTISLQSYNNGGSITFGPPFGYSTIPEVTLERPAPGETVRGVMRISGITFDRGTFITRRDVFIDDVQRLTAGSQSRADFCAANPVPGCPLVGFLAERDLAALNLAPGPHTIWMRVTNGRGAFQETAPITFIVDSAPGRLPKGAIETPAAGAELSGTVQFRGYAYAEDLSVARVDLLIDGLTRGGIAYGAAAGAAGTRTDVCGALPAPLPPNCPMVGWTLTLNTRTGSPPLPDGPHVMQLRVQDQGGRFTLLPEEPVPFTVRNGAQTFPTGALTSIQPGARLSGIVPISGYAYSPGGRVTSVLVLVDGSGVASAQYGLPRPEECATLPGVEACPNIGFNANLDTRTLSNGSHVIGVRITNDAGLGVTVPNLARNGMSVTVDNR